MPHLRRAPLSERHPVHVTIRARPHVFNLRAGRCWRVIRAALGAARERFGMRVCHFSVMGNHLHLLVEAQDRRALGRGMKGLGVRVAKALNRVMSASQGRRVRGAVLADRYHARPLRTPTEVARARNYVLTNAEKHELIRRGAEDPCSSLSPAGASATVLPRTWLLAVGWQRARGGW